MKSPFNFWDRNAYLEFQKENVRIYNMDGEQYLFVDQIMYASSTEQNWYINNVMNYAHGKCLEIGLGLGIASKVILAKPQVTHLLTIENNETVIEAFGRPLHRHNILWMDIYKWIDNFIEPMPMYDLIFIDHYTLDDGDIFDQLKDLASKLKKLLKENGRMIFWVDENSPEEDKEFIRKLWVIKK